MIHPISPRREITLLCVDGVYGWPSVNALYYSAQQFPFVSVKLLTPLEEFLSLRKFLRRTGIEVVRTEAIPNLDYYSYFCIKKLALYVDTDFFIVCQHDGYVVNSALWSPEYYHYDYIGAAWWDGVVGNGGFSMRSRKLLKALQDPRISDTSVEDVSICRRYRDLLQNEYRIRFAPVEVANRFSYEFQSEATTTFGYHGRPSLEGHRQRMIQRFGLVQDQMRRTRML